jgi:hypothetical protein
MAEGGIRLGGAPSLWVSGRAEYVAVHFEDPSADEPVLLGYGVPESLSAQITDYLKELPDMSPNDGAVWVLSLENPSRALFGKLGPEDGQLTFSWQGTKADEPVLEQMVPVSELEKWPGALDLYGNPDPEEIRNPEYYDRR